ncbi:PIN domain-containing protein [Candidatus Woesearchaeota archaeon]|nr:PIN domain-containing protein [Candidatus Woesearchaeota archaeon]
MVLKYFLDTYAFLEIIKGNKNYEKYADVEGYTTLLQLYELYFHLLRSFGSAVADTYFQKYLPLKIDIKDQDIVLAAKFRLKYVKQNISYADALGYVMAQERGLLFLTGDKEFHSFGGVAFVK